MQNHIIKTKRFTLRELVASDASELYLDWLKNENNQKYIITSKETQTINDLENYISTKNISPNAILWGIFHENIHIGNIKYEPINFNESYAVMGILIGDLNWRGKGIASEVIEATSRYLKNHFSITTVILGVDSDNLSAIKAYIKTGFIISDFREYVSTSKSIFMTLSS